MTNEEIIKRAKDAKKRTRFGELVHNPVSKGVNSAYGIGFIEGMVEYRNSLQEELVSKELEDVSKRYALRQVMASTDTQLTEQAYLSLRLFNGYDLAAAHKDGAQWQKNKMMEDAVDGIVAASAGGDDWVNIATGFVKSEDVNVKYGDKIKIIIIKNDEL